MPVDEKRKIFRAGNATLRPKGEVIGKAVYGLTDGPPNHLPKQRARRHALLDFIADKGHEADGPLARLCELVAKPQA